MYSSPPFDAAPPYPIFREEMWFGTSLPIVSVRDIEADSSLYGYTPPKWICVLFVVLFAITTPMHSHLWWLLLTPALAGITELIGWSGRLWSSVEGPRWLNPFLVQITTTIIAPTFLIADFVILGQIARRLGPQYCRLSPVWYTIIFCSFDVVALIVQAVGGAKASQAVQNNEDPNPGGNIMLGGIVLQLGAVCIYLILATEFLLRYARDMPIRTSAFSEGDVLERSVQLMIVGLVFDAVFILIRSIYRTIGLTDGWNGRIINTQVYFSVLDGAAILLAMYTLNIFHPGNLLGAARNWKGRSDCSADSEHLSKEAKRAKGGSDTASTYTTRSSTVYLYSTHHVSTTIRCIAIRAELA